jgi:hypothetical protein
VNQFHTDGGGEYTSKTIVEHLKPERIINETTVPFVPQLNAVTGWAYLIIEEHVRCMLDDA